MEDLHAFDTDRQHRKYKQHKPHGEFSFATALGISGIGPEKMKKFIDNDIDSLAKLHKWVNPEYSTQIRAIVPGIGRVLKDKIRRFLSRPDAENSCETHHAFLYGPLEPLSSNELLEARERFGRIYRPNMPVRIYSQVPSSLGAAVEAGLGPAAVLTAMATTATTTTATVWGNTQATATRPLALTAPAAVAGPAAAAVAGPAAAIRKRNNLFRYKMLKAIEDLTEEEHMDEHAYMVLMKELKSLADC